MEISALQLKKKRFAVLKQALQMGISNWPCCGNLGVEGQVKTNLGSINSRLTDIEVVREKKDRGNQQLHFRRVLEESMAQINASNNRKYFPKDTDNN